jgi:hypothetical protein
MAVTDAWAWRPARIEALDGLAGECLAPICDLLEDQLVEPAELHGRVAWGQFLDRRHHSQEQWGRFGTSAAVQVFAMAHRWDEPDRSVYATAPLNVLADVLPEDPPSDGDATPKREDFDDPVKLAFVIDGLRLDVLDQKVQGRPPGVVEKLLAMALPTREGWSSLGSDDRQRHDRLLVTAYALRTLRRFPVAQADERVADAWEWLAVQLQRRAKVLGEDLLALGCLALRACPDSRQSRTVHEALESGSGELLRRVANTTRPAIDRPYFNPYSRGEVNDYLFLSPELLTALFFLEDDGRPADSRAFVLAVADRIVKQIRNENRDPADPQGFRVQRGMLGTVDQMWAIRVLYAFHCAFRRNPAALRPAPSLVLRSGVVAVPVCIGLVVASILWLGKPGAIIATVVGAVLGAIFTLFIRRDDA